MISIHAPAKGATRSRCSFSPIFLHFNPRSREGSDGHGKSENMFGKKFQSTLPRRERRRRTGRRGRNHYFNPRSREGSDGVHQGFWMLSDISIHAPAKGATGKHLGTFDTVEISIHAPAKGATIVSMLPDRPWNISIHAPAKGATGIVV